MNSPGYSPAYLLDMIRNHVQHAEHIREYVSECIRRAIDTSLDA
jgi:hypothetical protein